MESNEVLLLLQGLETAGEKVLTIRQEVVDLDRRRNSNREAIRSLKNMSKVKDMSSEKVWIAVGNTFLHIPFTLAEERLEQDQKALDISINKLRSRLKDRVNDLRDIEGKKELQGFGLKALDRHELEMVHQTIQSNIPQTKKFDANQF
uniref:p53 and DNA damage-regulated protein 1 n=1 Tax=Acartia pacifica TaxID=335913 RepID=A0A0U2TJP1_ACAPC|nr:p53 and DNA damage-regulated protein 1 [Acartia pacifica]